MSPIFNVVRKHRQGLRALFAVVALAFTLASIAHFNHRHDAPPGGTNNVQCELCVAFDRLVDPPVEPALPVSADSGDGAVDFFQVSVVQVRSVLRLIPRGPPTA